MKKVSRKPVASTPAVATPAPTAPAKEASLDNSLVKAQMEEEQQQAPTTDTPTLDEASSTGASALADELEKLAEGLTYISESDSDFTGVTIEANELSEGGAATEAELREGLDLAPEAALSIMSADDFWEYYTDESIHGEDAKRFVALRELLEDKLTGVQFVKHDGDEDWQKFIYLVGRAESGDLVGLRAESVET